MKHKGHTQSGKPGKPEGIPANSPTAPFSYRVPPELSQRFNDVLAASRRTKASLIHESLEVMLPDFERRYLATKEGAK